ncbi:MAG: DUF3575 domain-containing protein [Alistipes sp.]|nr:DUF3575 domain-containing protein [Alistipes sp.]
MAFLMPFIANAQEDSVSYRRERNHYSVYVDFRVNSTTLDPNYRDNRTVISRIDSLFKRLKEDTTITIEAIEFSGSASPEGNLELNRRLSRARMLEVEKYVRKHLAFDDEIVTYNDRIVDWEHLVELVEEDTTLYMRDEVLRIATGTYPDVKNYKGQSVDGRIPEIKKLDDGKVWNTLLRRYFVKMRNGSVIMRVYTDVPVIIEREPEPEVVEPEVNIEVIPESYHYGDPDPVVEESVEEPVEEPAPVEEPVEEAPVIEKTPLMSFKTNMLAYSTLVPNLGVEVRLADHWSAEITGLYSPFNLFAYNLKTRVLAMKPEVRYWFGEAMRKGHFIGIHMPVAGFNIQLNDDYRYQDPNHALWGVGLNYGYAMLLGKNQNWTIDFTIGLGYMDMKYDVYEGVRNGKYIRTEEKYYFGPTRIGVNIAYLINKKK